MKLYATTTSERASKGQGGDYLDIEIKGNNEDTLWTLQIRDYQNFYELRANNWKKTEYLTSKIIKGKSQKGECVYHGVKNCSRCDEFKH